MNTWLQFMANLNDKSYCHPRMENKFDVLSYCNLSKPLGEVHESKERAVNGDVSRDKVPKK